MSRLAHVLAIAGFLTIVGVAGGNAARAQGWDYGRNMFGFAQHYPGSGWSSYYHPDFDPDAFFPTTFGFRAHGARDRPYLGPQTVYAPRGIFDRGRWVHRRRRGVMVVPPAWTGR